MATVFIGIGSNVGDRAEHIALARKALTQLPQTELADFSEIYETAPVGPVVQGAFLNCAAKLRTDLQPLVLLGHLRAIERQAGRSEDGRIKWGPRPLDLDILFYDDCVINEPNLTVPHPHLHERWFVLKPLHDVAPDFVHVLLKKTVKQMLHDVEHQQAEQQTE